VTFDTGALETEVPGRVAREVTNRGSRPGPTAAERSVRQTRLISRLIYGRLVRLFWARRYGYDLPQQRWPLPSGGRGRGG
jgi:hypothetical protein